MNVLRRIFLVIVACLLAILLFATAIDAGIIRVAGGPDTVKKVLISSDIYNTAVNGALDQAKKISTKDSDLPLSDKTVRIAANAAFTPKFLQRSVETIIDSLYRWLDGQTKLPDFKVNLDGPKKAFVGSIAQSIQDRLKKLPACQTTAGTNGFDAFRAKCLPVGVNPSATAAKFKSELLANKDFLKDPVITATSLKTSGSKLTVFADQLKDVPQTYRRVKQTPIILGLLSLLLALVVVFLSRSRRHGLRLAGIILVLVGILIIALAVVANRVAVSQVLRQIHLNSQTLETNVKTLATDLIKELDKTYEIIGGSFALLGALAIAGTMFIGRRGKGANHAESEPHQATAGPPAPQPAKHETPQPESPVSTKSTVQPAVLPSKVSAKLSAGKPKTVRKINIS